MTSGHNSRFREHHPRLANRFLYGALFALLFLWGNIYAWPALSADQQPPLQENYKESFARLYECADKVYKFNLDVPEDQHYDIRTLAKDLFIILDTQHNTLFIYTPFFAGKADLNFEPQPPLERMGVKISNIRIPSSPPQSSTPNGYYYLSLSDRPTAAHHEARIDQKPRRLVSGDKGYGNPNYYPLSLEERIWDATAQSNFSPEAEYVLASVLGSLLNTMPREIVAGSSQMCSLCEHHTFTKAEADADHSAHADVLTTCQKVGDELHLELTSAQKADLTSETVTLSLSTDPPGAWCRCVGEETEGKDGWPTVNDVFVIDKTPGSFNIRKGIYKDVSCRCTNQDSQNMCQISVYQFREKYGRKILADQAKTISFSDPLWSNRSHDWENTLEFIEIPAQDCRMSDPTRCAVDSDCLGGVMCFRKDATVPFAHMQRESNLQCQCVKGFCQPK